MVAGVRQALGSAPSSSRSSRGRLSTGPPRVGDNSLLRGGLSRGSVSGSGRNSASFPIRRGAQGQQASWQTVLSHWGRPDTPKEQRESHR